MRKLGLVPIILAAVALAAPAQARPEAPPHAQSFFGPDKVYTLHLRMTEEAWQLMQPTRRARPAVLIADSIPAPTTQPARKAAATRAAAVAPAPVEPRAKPPAISGDKLAPNNFGFEYVYVKADLECDGERLADVAVRFKGNSSYENYTRSLRRPLKVDFDRFVPGRRLHGLGTINLSNNAFDYSQLREALSYEVYRRAGVPAPRTAFANVYLTVDGGRYDRQLVGFYTIVEEVDEKAFLRDHFDDAGGILVKPEGIRGLPYLGEAWEPYAERYHAKTPHAPPDLAKGFVEFVKLVNYADDATFAARIGDHLAVDNYLRWIAATSLVASLDSPLANNHNFYLYASPADRRVWMMPWDMNLSFGGYGTVGSRDDQVNLSVKHPWASNKLIDRLMRIEANAQAYRRHLRSFVEEFYNAKTMGALMDQMRGPLDRADEAAAAANRPPVATDGSGGGGMFGRSQYSLREFITLRAASVLAQLDGKDVPTFEPQATTFRMGFRWGLVAPPEFGELPALAQAIRKFADADGDYKLSGRELRDAAAALFYAAADEDKPDAVGERALAAGLAPLLRDLPFPQQSRGFLGFGRGGPAPQALWARQVVLEADTDRDGRVTLAELTNLVDRLACVADRDQSGKLDEREIAEGLDALATSGRR